MSNRFWRPGEVASDSHVTADLTAEPSHAYVVEHLASRNWWIRNGLVMKASLNTFPVVVVGISDGAPRPTEIEIRVLAFSAGGLRDREIARELGRTEHQVKYAVRNAMTRLSALTRAHAVAIALSRGYIVLGQPARDDGYSRLPNGREDLAAPLDAPAGART